MSAPPPPGQPGPYGAPYPPPPALSPYFPPDHPSANTALVLGIVGLVGAMFCLVPILLSPFAWVIGGRAVREIDAAQGRLGGRASAQTGRVLGIIGTALMVLAVLAIVAIVLLVAGLGLSTGPDGMPA